MNTSKGSGRIDGLDGVRALCVMLVFIEHFVVTGYGVGGLGVQIFFALSGFLIIGNLHSQRLKIEVGSSTSSCAELRRFWINRVLRIYPIYYVALVGMLVYGLIKGHGPTWQGLPYYAFFLGNYYIQSVSHSWGKFTHLWSLSVEQHFYMLASPVLLWVVARWHMRVVIGLFVISVIAACHDFITWSTVPTPYVPDLPNFAFMACGGLLALARFYGRRTPSAVSGSVFAASLVAYLLVISNATPLSDPGLKAALRDIASLGICFGALAYVPNAAGSPIVRLLELRPMRYLGTISYGFYVCHYFFPRFERLAIHATFLPYALAASLLVAAQFALTFGVAALSWRYIEQPLLRLKVRLSPNNKTAARNSSPNKQSQNGEQEEMAAVAARTEA